MDLTNFDTINDMLRSFSSEPSNIDMLLQQSGNLDSFMATLNNTSNPPPTTPTAPINDDHPQFHKSFNDISPHHPPHSNNYYEDDIFTPLISPAMTPSFSYHPHHQQQHHQHQQHPGPVSQEMDFSPLTSPAIMPQQHLHSNQYQHQHSRESSNSNMTVPVSMPPSSMPTSEDSDMTPSQIYEQYEQLERAKIMITRRLSELHKHQKRPREEEQIQQQKHIQQQQRQLHRRISDQQQPLSPAGSPCIEPVTPASLMKIKSNNGTPPVAVIKPVTPITPKTSSPPAKKSRRIAVATTTNNSSTPEHASPRALKPLLISPTLRPGPTPSPLVHDAEHILATRSNYQNLMEGKAAALGIAFSSNIKSGLEIRRTAHKAAEQKRRDSLKEWFDRLRREVEEGYVKQKEKTERELLQQQQQQEKPRQEQQPQSPTDQEQNGKDEEPKPLSKVLLLKYAYEYISSLKDIIEEKDQRIRQLERQQ